MNRPPVAACFAACGECERRDGGRCLEGGRDIARHAYGFVPCPLGKFGRPGTPGTPPGPLPGADLADYDPDASPESPKAGGCCDPPRVRE
jgi:hypothetical protein